HSGGLMPVPYAIEEQFFLSLLPLIMYANKRLCTTGKTPTTMAIAYYCYLRRLPMAVTYILPTYHHYGL
ncbi:MAG: hypothetical protein MUO64_21905, partial [Anaerolineales bacterium]|nr:hypothetical protein [Anaerolineales bacterium]